MTRSEEQPKDGRRVWLEELKKVKAEVNTRLRPRSADDVADGCVDLQIEREKLELTPGTPQREFLDGEIAALEDCFNIQQVDRLHSIFILNPTIEILRLRIQVEKDLKMLRRGEEMEHSRDYYRGRKLGLDWVLNRESSLIFYRSGERVQS